MPEEVQQSKLGRLLDEYEKLTKAWGAWEAKSPDVLQRGPMPPTKMGKRREIVQLFRRLEYKPMLVRDFIDKRSAEIEHRTRHGDIGDAVSSSEKDRAQLELLDTLSGLLDDDSWSPG